MRIAITTDCWSPETNGIVVTLEATVRELKAMGHEVLLLTPQMFGSVELPYGDRLVLPSYRTLDGILTGFRPESVHIATQGVLGLTARRWCARNQVHFTTAFHTRFPEYARIRFGLPERLTYRYAKWFHDSAPVLVPSRALAAALEARRIGRPRLWSRGVDTDVFRPGVRSSSRYPRPILLYVGRVVEEKNIEAFFRLDTPGTRIVVGDGPEQKHARARHPDIVFLGELRGEALASCYREADVVVFPSLLDTFGLVVLEALASGVPVAAFATAHLLETFGGLDGVALDDDLAAAVERARTVPSRACRALAERFSWRACTRQFIDIIEDDLASSRARLRSWA